ncbi:hypothetical protein AGLY_001830 [Aphis glycines]|uniref:Uncharacterized protein n=1 Tax=Aphis glycines TaxID=307491 RepID=A0A6G0U4U1_APHGL|nr:hypothetical protein AGLY_001830 [Aphis glycines]
MESREYSQFGEFLYPAATAMRACGAFTYNDIDTKSANSIKYITKQKKKWASGYRSTLQEEQLIRNLFFWSSKIFLPTLQKKIRIKIENFSVFELQPYKKIDSVENWFCVKIPVFPSFFFLFFSIFLKTVGKRKLFTSIMHQGYSLLHRKPPPLFEIGALFRLVMMCTDTKKKKKKKNIHHCKINTFFTPFKI